VIYYVTDLFTAYGDKPSFVTALERRLCGVADLVCPNSRRIAEFLTGKADCDPAKITIVPNATRAVNTTLEPGFDPPFATCGPAELNSLRRPIAGVIGNLAGNTDWSLLAEVIERTPWLSWTFVGPTEMNVADPLQRGARSRLQQLGDRIRFVGEKPYGLLRDYAGAVDVAVLPYRKCEPTYSGSSTRFYEHLATGRPMIATRGFAELLDKEPLLRLIDSAGEMVSALDELRALNFRDGYEAQRWIVSQNETWEARAQQMRSALAKVIAGRRAIGQDSSDSPTDSIRASEIALQ